MEVGRAVAPTRAVVAGGAREAAVVFLVATLLSLAMTYPLVRGIGRLGRLDTGDGRMSIWNVTWVAHALTTSPSHLFDANIFHPHRGTLLYTESNIFPGVLGIPAWVLTRNPYATHNVAFLLAFVLSSSGMYYLVRHLTGNRPAAAVAGVLFAYCPFVFAHTAHIQLEMTAALPFGMLAFHRLLERPGASRGAALGLVLAATVLSCGYYTVALGMLLGAAVLWFLVTRPAIRCRGFFGGLAVAGLVAAVLCWPLIRQYASLAADRPFRSLEENGEYAANISAYLAAAGLGNQWLLRFTGHFAEVLFPGIVTLALASLGVAMCVWRKRDEAALLPCGDVSLFYGAAGLMAFWISFGPAAGLYTLLYRYVPMFTLMRAPGRFGLIVTFALVVVGAIGLARILSAQRRAWMWAAGLMLVAACELAPVPLPFREAEPPGKAYRVLAKLPRGGLVEWPFFYKPGDFHRHTYYMLYSTFHWQPLVNGYSDYIPEDFAAMAAPLNGFPSNESFEILRAHQARYVLFHSAGYDAGSRQHLLARIAQFRAYLNPLVVEGDEWLYEIVAWPAANSPS